MGTAAAIAAASTAAFNSHDASQIRALYAEDVRFTAPDVTLEGADAATEYAMAWLRAFPDSRLVQHNVFATEEWATTQFTFEGTHTDTLSGPDGDIPATHRSVAGRGVDVIRVVDGKVTEEHLYYDQMQILAQLGLVPEHAATA